MISTLLTLKWTPIYCFFILSLVSLTEHWHPFFQSTQTPFNRWLLLWYQHLLILNWTPTLFLSFPVFLFTPLLPLHCYFKHKVPPIADSRSGINIIHHKMNPDCVPLLSILSRHSPLLPLLSSAIPLFQARIIPPIVDSRSGINNINLKILTEYRNHWI